jgi:YidC/Oxa1 family membrane protein insertase
VAEEIVVEHTLSRITLSTAGARITSVELPTFSSAAHEGPVRLIEEGGHPLLGTRLAVDGDTTDFRNFIFVPTQRGSIQIAEGDSATLGFRYEHPSGGSLEVEYTFRAGSYLVEVRNRVMGVPRGVVLTDLGTGIPYNEVDDRSERRTAAYVVNHLQSGIRSTAFAKAPSRAVVDGPFLWAAVKSQYFVTGILPGLEQGGGVYLGGVSGRGIQGEDARAEVAVMHPIGAGGELGYRFYAGPQDYSVLTAVGSNFQDVSPVGWGWLRPVLRPIIGVIMWVLVFLHVSLSVGYGWVLILFGVLMRILLFPLNHKAMRSQLRNMAVQPLLKEIQTKYKDQPEKMQKELMRLYKEHGFNPLAGCWPLLLPWPILIALFFAFQHAIELRGTSFAWLPDLAAKDPFFILPILLGISMFLLQWISFRTMDEVRPEMKLMMWMLPVMMVVLFANLPSGLNVYYLSTNIATLPQTWWIAGERKKQQAKGPPVATKKKG